MRNPLGALSGVLLVAATADASDLRFVPNLGQWSDALRAHASAPGLDARLHDRGMLLVLPLEEGRAGAVDLVFAGAAPVAPSLSGELEGVHRYFVGRGSESWVDEVPGFSRASWEEPWPGVRVLALERGGKLSIDAHVAAGASSEAIELAFEGARDLALDPAGALLVEASGGRLRLDAPRAWQVDTAGARDEVEVRWRIDGARAGFEVEGRASENALEIDPGIEWLTNLGGNQGERVHDVLRGALGDLYVCGETASADFPVTTGASTPVGIDAFVSRTSVDGTTLVWTSFLGGMGSDIARGLDLDVFDGPALTGSTTSTDFPIGPATTNPVQATYGGGTDAFVARVDQSGLLLSSSYFGGAGLDVGEAVCVLDDGTSPCVIVGRTDSTGLVPAGVNTSDATHNSPSVPPITLSDGLIARFDISCQTLEFAAYLGSSGRDQIFDVEEGSNQEVVFVGSTDIAGLPVSAGAFQTAFPGSSTPFFPTLNGFVGRWDTSQNGLLNARVWLTYLGGTDSTDQAVGLALDDQERPIVVGSASAATFPDGAGGVPSFDATVANNAGDAFVVRMDAAATTVEHRSFLGGTGTELANEVDVDETGFVVIAGETSGAFFPPTPDFPTTPGALQSGFQGGTLDAFTALVDPDGTRLLYSSYLGGPGVDRALACTFAENGGAILVGEAGAGFLPTTAGALDMTSAGASEGFVLQHDLLPTGATRYGVSTPNCNGTSYISMNRSPSSPSSTFELHFAGGPPNQTGYLFVAGLPDIAGTTMFGISVHFLTSTIVLAPAITTDANGYAFAPTAIPGGIGGGLFTFYLQTVWVTPTSCAVTPANVTASSAIALTVQ